MTVERLHETFHLNEDISMTTFQRIAMSGSAAALSFGLAFAAIASDGRPTDHGMLTINVRGKIELRGTVSKVDLVAKTLGVKVWGTEWTVKVGDATKIAPNGNAAGFTLADILVDHVVQVGGTLDAASPLVVNARKVVDQSLARRVAGYVGTVTALASPDAFTLQLTRGGQLTVKVTADTKITEGDATKAYADIAVGTPVAVKGTYDSATNTVTAVKVVLRPADAGETARGFEKPDFKGRGPRR